MDTIDISLTKSEVEFLRDVFGMITPNGYNDGEPTEGNVCQMLAQSTDRVDLEEELWDKLIDACETMDVPTGDEAPTFAVSAKEIPTNYIYNLEE
jgi:hypothetical protein